VITLIDVPFFAAAAWAASKAVTDGKPRRPSQILPPGVPIPRRPEDTAHGEPIPGQCAGAHNIVRAMDSDDMLARYISPGDSFSWDLTTGVRVVHWDVDEWAGDCWRIIRRSTLRNRRGNWPAWPQQLNYRWDGENDDGRMMPAGEYRLRIWAPGSSLGGQGRADWLSTGNVGGFGIYRGRWGDGGSNAQPGLRRLR